MSNTASTEASSSAANAHLMDEDAPLLSVGGTHGEYIHPRDKIYNPSLRFYSESMVLQKLLDLLKHFPYRMPDGVQRTLVERLYTSVFGEFLLWKPENCKFKARLIAFLYFHSVYPDRDDELHFNINDSRVKFGKKEFAIIMGYRFGDLNVQTSQQSQCLESPSPLHDSPNNVTLNKIINVLKDPTRPVEMIYRLALVYVIYGVLLGHNPTMVIPINIFYIVEDLERVETYPWGEYAYNHLMRSWRKIVLFLKGTEQKFDERQKAKRQKPQFGGCLFAIQTWCFHIIPNTVTVSEFKHFADLRERYETKLPTYLRWKCTDGGVYSDTIRSADYDAQVVPFFDGPEYNTYAIGLGLPAADVNAPPRLLPVPPPPPPSPPRSGIRHERPNLGAEDTRPSQMRRTEGSRSDIVAESLGALILDQIMPMISEAIQQELQKNDSELSIAMANLKRTNDELASAKSQLTADVIELKAEQLRIRAENNDLKAEQQRIRADFQQFKQQVLPLIMLRDEPPASHASPLLQYDDALASQTGTNIGASNVGNVGQTETRDGLRTPFLRIPEAPQTGTNTGPSNVGNMGQTETGEVSENASFSFSSLGSLHGNLFDLDGYVPSNDPTITGRSIVLRETPTITGRRMVLRETQKKAAVLKDPVYVVPDNIAHPQDTRYTPSRKPDDDLLQKFDAWIATHYPKWLSIKQVKDKCNAEHKPIPKDLPFPEKKMISAGIDACNGCPLTISAEANFWYILRHMNQCLLNEHIDAYLSLLNKRMMSRPEYYKGNYVVAYSAISEWFKNNFIVWHARQKEDSSAQPPEMPKHIKELAKEWTPEMMVLLPWHIPDANHWIMVEIDIHNWKISYKDCLLATGDFDYITRMLMSLARFLPMVFENNLAYQKHPQLSRKKGSMTYLPPLFSKKSSGSVPQMTSKGDGGVFMLKHIEFTVLKTGNLNCITQERIQGIRKGMCVDLFYHIV